MTIADQVAALLGDDGQVFETADGRTLADLAAEYGAEIERASHEAIRYTWPDGSVIVEVGGAWDLGYPHCWCWQGVGHLHD